MQVRSATNIRLSKRNLIIKGKKIRACCCSALPLNAIDHLLAGLKAAKAFFSPDFFISFAFLLHQIPRSLLRDSPL
jgi:hypothetical protein